MIDFGELWYNILAFHWLWKFLLGMYIAYSMMSPKLRRLTSRFFIWIFHTGSPFIKPNRQPVRQIVRKPTTENQTFLYKAKTIDRYASNNHIEIEDGKIEEWINSNPDLKKLNSQ